MKNKCPRCGTEYDLLDEAASEAMGGLCAACWCDWREKNIVRGQKTGNREKREEQRRRKLVSSH